MAQLLKPLEDYLSTTHEILLGEGLTEPAYVLRRSSPSLSETDWDWGNECTVWTLYLDLQSAEYAQLGARLGDTEEAISGRFNSVVKKFEPDIFKVKIVPRVERADSDWRNDSEKITAGRRKNIIDGIRLEKIRWHGVLSEVEFLQRLYDLKSMPSYDHRFKDAAGDIWQHRVNNEDWPEDWVFDDARFDMAHCPTDEFLRFLCEMVHPVVRPERTVSGALVQQFNDQLKLEGWQIVESELIAGRPRYIPRRTADVAQHSVSRVRAVAEALEAGGMQREIARLEVAMLSDPALAIGTAKDILESCCKVILSNRNVEYSRSADLTSLTKLLSKELKLVPEDISDHARGAEIVRLILRNLSSITQYLAELRGLYGSGHGRSSSHKGLEARHARLAVGAAATFIDFVAATHHQRQDAEKAAVAERQIE